MRDDSIGYRIRQLRKSAGLTQNKLAARLQAQGTNASTKHIYLWEVTGVVPTTEYVMALSRALNVSTDYLLGLTPLRNGDANGIRYGRRASDEKPVVENLPSSTDAPQVRRLPGRRRRAPRATPPGE